MTDGQHAIRFTYLSQEDLLEAGCLDFQLAMDAAESALLAHRNGDVLFPDKIVQIFNDEAQERINCLPATLRTEKIYGMKWVSVFLPNVPTFGLQSLTALFVLSEIEKGFPFAVMEGTLAPNIRVGAMAALAARSFAPERARMIGFIGSGEQAKMHLLAMKTVRPSLAECRGRREDGRGAAVRARTCPDSAGRDAHSCRDRWCPGYEGGRHPRHRHQRPGSPP
jgi:N-[(2S)-2-amino-2-carboxyethyl]-L-glutamate dehydrogenase